ncbi:DUF885 domain-containing protein [Microbulbifer sp. JTAC008]|uniref:DUF885 domain-containing protein n=1 Tax=unclassified Microbulbifer TaxID=2619833 RepID=UPI00403900AA
MKNLKYAWVILCVFIGLPAKAYDQEFDYFIEVSNAELLRRDPELALIHQVHEEIGLLSPGITPISLQYKAKTLALYVKVLAKLKSFDRRKLSEVQKVDYDYYLWFLKNYLSVEGQPQFRVNAFTAISAWYVFQSFNLDDVSGVENYLEQMKRLPSYYSSINSWLSVRARLGIIDDKETVIWVSDTLEFWNEVPEQDNIYLLFESAVNEMAVSDLQKEEWLLQCKDILANQIAPARAKVSSKLLKLLPNAPENPGFSQYPGGNEFYNRLLSRFVGLPQDAHEAHQIGIAALKDIHTEIYSEFESLGYDVSNDLPTLYEMARRDSPQIAREDVLSVFKTLLDEAAGKSAGLFPDFQYPELEFIESLGYGYRQASGGESAVIFVDTSVDTTLLELPGFVYHEGIPGHHAQFSFTGNLDLPLFRSITNISGFSEGWGLYAERLAFEQGWHDNNPYGNLGRLQAEARRAARLVVDTGINAKGWDLTEAEEYFSQATGLVEWEVFKDLNRFVFHPGQASSYHIGFTHILQLRQKEQERVNFDIKEFHGKILKNGVIPLSLLSDQFSGSQ